MMRKTITKIFKLLKQFSIFLISAVILYFVAALILSFAKTHPPKTDCLAENEIYITTNGVHLFSPAKTSQSAPVLFHLHPPPSRPGYGAGFQSLFCHLRKTSEVSCFSCSIFSSSKVNSGLSRSCAISL